MPDREKVIKGLENCITGFDCPSECPYLMSCNDLAKPMFVDLAKDALALLKEQEEEIENLKQTCQSMMEGAYLLKEQESKRKNRLPYSPDSNVQWT